MHVYSRVTALRPIVSFFAVIDELLVKYLYNYMVLCISCDCFFHNSQTTHRSFLHVV